MSRNVTGPSADQIYEVIFFIALYLRLLTTTYSSICPQPLPQRVLHTGLSNPPSFSFHYPLLSLRTSSSCLRLYLRPFVTSTFPYICSSTACVERQVLHRMWPIQLAFLRVTLCRILLFSLTLSNTSFLTRSPAPHLKTFKLLLTPFPHGPCFITIQC
jgi:hypothetical protein